MTEKTTHGCNGTYNLLTTYSCYILAFYHYVHVDQTSQTLVLCGSFTKYVIFIFCFKTTSVFYIEKTDYVLSAPLDD